MVEMISECWTLVAIVLNYANCLELLFEYLYCNKLQVRIKLCKSII